MDASPEFQERPPGRIEGRLFVVRRCERPRRLRPNLELVLERVDLCYVIRLGRIDQHPRRKEQVRRIELVDGQVVLPGSWKTRLT